MQCLQLNEFVECFVSSESRFLRRERSFITLILLSAVTCNRDFVFTAVGLPV